MMKNILIGQAKLINQSIKPIIDSIVETAARGCSQITEGIIRDASTQNNGLVDTTAALTKIIDSLDGLPTTPPSLYIDLEGENLSRHGTLAILQLHILPSSQTHLIDIKTLSHDAFHTRGAHGRTFKEVLESAEIPKVFFDVRTDSDALYSHFQINLAGIHDLQLMEIAKRPLGRKTFVSGLGKCIEYDANLSLSETVAFKANKEKGARLFKPHLGSSFKVFNERPLRREIQEYCIQDVKYLPRLWSIYYQKLTPAWRSRVFEATKARVAESQGPNFNGVGMHMAIPPTGWQSL